jgi:AraC-like DNA-binding protein
MTRPALEKHSGILNPRTGEQKFHLSRHPPGAGLEAFVERYWIIHWDLRGQAPHLQETLPNACINLVVEKHNTKIYGVTRGRSARLIENAGTVFGIKFRPGAFYPFVKWPLSRLAGSSIGLCEVFGVEGAILEAEILPLADEGQMVRAAENFLRPRLPEPDESAALVNRIVDCIVDERGITRVEQLVSRFHLGNRTLQRLFGQYVGLSPKWVIQCYRLQDAAWQLASGQPVDFPKLALELGYFDQAHFIKDFKAIVGVSPAAYARGPG